MVKFKTLKLPTANIYLFSQIVFDPNPTSALEKISASYSTCGIRVLVIKAAAGHLDTPTRIDDAQEEVEVVKIAKYITTVVTKRALPSSAAVTTPRVVVNLGGSPTTQLKVVKNNCNFVSTSSCR